MATKKIWLPQDIYQIKVTLRYTRPPIWRRLLVPAGLTLDGLHDVLQLAMGWDGSHMHDFRIGQKRFGKPDPNDRLMGLDPHPPSDISPSRLWRSWRRGHVLRFQKD